MQPPAMSAAEIAAHPSAPVRINCYRCRRCLYASDELPGGDVYAAAGCNDDPRTCPGAEVSLEPVAEPETLGAVPDVPLQSAPRPPQRVEAASRSSTPLHRMMPSPDTLRDA